MERTRYRCGLVTGASAGLGEEFARQLAPRCGTLVLVARREERLREVAQGLANLHPGLAVRVMGCDLADAARRAELVAAMEREGLVPDVLVNNAGLGDYGEFVTSDWRRVDAMLRVNIEALTHLTHALLPGMLGTMGDRQERAAVVNVSSLASLLPMPDFAVYAASKAYVTSFSEALRLELRGTGVSVLAVCPGPVRTEFGSVARRGGSGREMPARAAFYVPKEQVVREALAALADDRPRVFPGWKVAAVAALVGLLPLCAIRLAMSCRPRRAR